MKIIEPNFSLYTPSGLLTEEKGIELLRWVEFNARISHRSEESQTEDSWKRFLKSVVIDRGDWSVTEHASVTVIFRLDRGVTHELVRHRLFSFTQESSRFVNAQKKYPEGVEFIKPAFTGDDTVEASSSWNAEIHRAEQAYVDQLSMGQPPQIARSLLPNALASTISVTGNLRNWRHFMLMRSTRETHPDFRRVVLPMISEFKRLIPILYEDIESDRQITNLSKPR